MAIRRTYRGNPIDMEEIIRSNDKTVAVGNMRTNARGDVLGKGGKIIKSAGEVNRQHYDNTVKTVADKASLKTPLEKEKPVEKKQVKSTTAKRNQSRATETELPNGDIVIDPKE